MKKILSVMMCMLFVLCGCSNEKPLPEEQIDIPFQKVAACNNRAKLLDKYSYILERTASRASENDDFSYWTMYYENDGENTNAILDYSVNYKCYYYNNEIFAEYGDSQIRKVIPYRENYDKVITSLLARTDTLSYVFIMESVAYEDPDEDGYVAEYQFIVNNDILEEFEGLGLETGDRVQVEYDLDSDLVIKRCRYKKLEGLKKTEIARIDITYGEKKSFPESITSINGPDDEYVTVGIIENFGTGAQYSESFKVKKGSYITENDVLMKYYLFKDPTYQTVFDTMTEEIQKDTDIFIVESTYADVLQLQQEYMQQQEQQNAE